MLVRLTLLAGSWGHRIGLSCDSTVTSRSGSVLQNAVKVNYRSPKIIVYTIVFRTLDGGDKETQNAPFPSDTVQHGLQAMDEKEGMEFVFLSFSPSPILSVDPELGVAGVGRHVSVESCHPGRAEGLDSICLRRTKHRAETGPRAVPSWFPRQGSAISATHLSRSSQALAGPRSISGFDLTFLTSLELVTKPRCD